MKMHRSGREYRRKVDRDDYELEDSRREAENEYYKIQLKVAAKIKQEEERGEGKRYREREGENTRVKIDEENISKVEEGVEPEGQRSKERSDDDRREVGGSEDRRERGGSKDRRERGGSDDQRERRSNDRSRANSRENQTNEMLKSEMMKLEKEQAPAPQPPVAVDNHNASSDRKPVFYDNQNVDQKPFNKENQDNKQHVVVNNNQNQNGNWNNQINQNNFKYEPVSEFQSKYQMMANDPNNCKFYMKTGACRFGPRCSRNHLRYENSPTILIPNFFQDPRLAIPMLNERRTDSGMEYDEVEMIHEFEKFYDDVIGEFRAAGNVMMFKCCQNFVPHLRGNVYVQYSKPEYAVEAMKMFNGRFYAGRQLSVELSPVTNWKSSICGLFDKRLCPRGKACNFLHVFRNPGNAYSVPNRTDFDPERAFRSGGYDPSFVNPNHPVFKYYNQRDAYGYRSETAKQTTTPTVTHTRNKWDNDKNEKSRSRSRSRDRDHSSRKRHHSHSRSHSRGRSKSRSHSRSRSRSRSRRRKHSRSKSRSRSHSKSRSKSHSKEKERSKKSPKKTRKHSRSSRSSSRGSTKKKHNNDSDVSDTSTDWSDISLDE